MLKKVYIGNLPITTTESEIKKLLEKFGSVHSVSIVADRESGRSRGFGFIEMETNGAREAIKALNGSSFRKHNLLVQEARERLRMKAEWSTKQD